MATRRDFLRYAGAAAVCAGLAAPAARSQQTRRNVLMIAVDDMRPEWGAYGAKHIHAPNLDRLAASGTLFERAYTMVATCSPSRTCLMTGCRPDTTRVYDLETHFRKFLPDVVTLPQHFKQHGYDSVGMGKIYHGGLNDDPSWSRWLELSSGPQWLDPKTQAHIEELVVEARAKGLTGKEFGRATRGTVTECLDVPDNAYFDGAMADRAVQELKDYAASGKPFFMAVGFKKPHLPFVAPKRYWDLYDRDEIATAANAYHPKNMPQGAVDSFPGETNSYYDARNMANAQKAKGIQDFPEPFAKQIIHAYFACISYVDAQVGRLLDTLAEAGLEEKTVVALWGDHGWHLGENGTWGKHTNLERGTHAPLIVRVPGQRNAGVSTPRLAEFVDVYPTLADACGLDIPAHCEGTSLMPLLDAPARPWKGGAFSQYRKNINGVACMGYTLRTEEFRYTEWRKRDNLDEIVARELYDHRENNEENENIAPNPEFSAVLEEHAAKMKAGWKPLRPV